MLLGRATNAEMRIKAVEWGCDLLKHLLGSKKRRAQLATLNIATVTNITTNTTTETTKASSATLITMNATTKTVSNNFNMTNTTPSTSWMTVFWNDEKTMPSGMKLTFYDNATIGQGTAPSQNSSAY